MTYRQELMAQVATEAVFNLGLCLTAIAPQAQVKVGKVEYDLFAPFDPNSVGLVISHPDLPFQYMVHYLIEKRRYKLVVVTPPHADGMPPRFGGAEYLDTSVDVVARFRKDMTEHARDSLRPL